MSHADVCTCGHDEAAHKDEDGDWTCCQPMWRCGCLAYWGGTRHQREDHPVHNQPAPPAVVDFGWMSFAPATQDAITAAATCPCRTHPCSCDQRADQGDDQ